MKIFAYHIHRAVAAVVMAVAAFVSTFTAVALDPSHYAETSRMASGTWVKISVPHTGVHFVSNEFIRRQGFSDPQKVNVYGYGGRIISELLNADQVDDLPVAPSVHTDKGIVFFGYGLERWSPSSSSTMLYEHELNPYSTQSIYFLSDAPLDGEIAQAPTAEPNGNRIKSFTERLYHEQDLVPPSNTGRVFLGEDFRTQTTRPFSFPLTGNVGDKAEVRIRFAAAATNGSPSFTVSANGTNLPASTQDVLKPLTSSEAFMSATTSYKTVEKPGSNLELKIAFSAAGSLTMARLDYIDVEYERALNMEWGQLYFFGNVQPGDTYELKGAAPSTVVMDITDTAKPLLVTTKHEGDALVFTAHAGGYREYVAFTPGEITSAPTAVCQVANQDIHAMPVPDMLIITPAEYVTHAERLAQMHRDMDGMTIHVLTPEVIYNEFSSGAPDVSAFRKCLKMWYDRSNEEQSLKHCLIYSRPTYDNRMITDVVRKAGYPRVPIWQSINGMSHTTSYSTDAFIAMLEDNETAFEISREKFSIGIGRLPVKSVSEASRLTDKILRYVQEPIYGAWRNNVMVIADDQDNNVHFTQAQSVIEKMKSGGNGSDFLYTRLYLDAYPLEYTGSGPFYAEPHRLLQQAFKDGVGYIDYIGHASPRGWGHEGLMRWPDISGMTNKKLPFIYAATCEFARWDDDEVSGAEIMWQYPDAGVIGFITAARTVYMTQNGELNNAMSAALFQRDAQGRPKCYGDMFREGMNAITRSDDNKLRYMLMADPAMRIAAPALGMEITEINGLDMTDPDAEAPVITARSTATAKGRIVNADGSTATDFNGVLEPLLYDAERVVETYGNGASGQSVMYNDRKTRLYSGKFPVENGLWEITIPMPSEIENNWSPALLSLYAYSDAGVEANAACDRLYVYGMDPDAAYDDYGPEIHKFYINTPNFTSGDQVASSFLVKASMRDDSGINLSNAGIGHFMSLLLDGQTLYSDVADYYDADLTDPFGGSIEYLLTDIPAGEHTLKLTVWDNANNCSEREIAFVVSAITNPEIADLTTNVNPAKTDVTFTITHNLMADKVSATIEVFDLGGRRVWMSPRADASLSAGSASVNWNLTDGTGSRVPRGIYLYRATIETPEGRTCTKTKKLAVSAP